MEPSPSTDMRFSRPATGGTDARSGRLGATPTFPRAIPVLFDLFRHDMRLWKAYSMTLQSHPSFAEYHDLLDDLEEKLSSPANSEEK
ncbi:hypothetical protein V6N11_001574 [Hibiscus sabdariffa]|uniref:Uncharacterized protein n=1 Tax=Hibiscus sabdariffa TaxID=183260 RepID=A0ABR2S043_9ROSI